MIYGILMRYEGGPRDLVRLEPLETERKSKKYYYIKDVLIHEDKCMQYNYDHILKIWEYVVGSSFYSDRITLIEINGYDKIFEVEDDDSAKLYYEVLDQ